MITLPHHVEFLSEAWLEEARRYLEREGGRLGADAPRFSAAVRLTDAPSHLAFDGGVAVARVVWDGTTMGVDRTFDADADLVVQGDYQAVLTAAQAVGALAPGVLPAALHEVAHVFGGNALQVHDGLDDRRSRELLARLHDHLGRRTVENPDLAHRAERLGIADKVREMEEHGYTVLERAITPEFADAVRGATLRALLPHDHFQLQWMLYHGPEFERIVQNPQLMTLIDGTAASCSGW